MSYLFIKDAQTEQETHSSLIENTLPVTESFSDIIDSFLTTAERKLTGYSIGEIDILAKAAKNVDSEVKKRDLLKRIDAAITDAKKELVNTNKDDKKKDLRLQLQVLSELKNKVNSFKVTEHDEKKEDDEGNKKHRIDLDNL